MSKKLTIVVTCTDRKAVPPRPHLRVRELESDTIEVRAATWNGIMARATDRRPLSELYSGEAWRQVAKLETAVRAKGVQPTTLVASAGLGLRPVESAGPSYSATFALGQPDSVGTDRRQARTWWKLLNESHARNDGIDPFNGPTIFVLSDTYASAMTDTLRALEGRDDVVLFGGTDGLLTDQRIPSDIGLRHELGGTAVSLNLRMAIAWLQRQDDIDLRAAQSRGDWEAWAESVRSTTVYDRRPVDDASVTTWIRAARSSQPRLSKTAALRSIRESGLACEQRRFGTLFLQAMEGS